MIQRIQSVYLLLAGLVLAFSFCTPLVNYYNADNTAAGVMFATSILGTDGVAISHPYGVLTITLVSAVLSFVIIFLFKNRRLQIKLANILLLLILLLYVAIIAYSLAFNAKHDTTMSGTYGAVMPLVAYILGWLGRRGIRKDEELVRSAERFR